MKKYVIVGIVAALLGMMIFSACGSTSSSEPNQVNITLSEFKVASSQTTFTPGKTYHFVVTNQGNTNHEFMLMPPMSGQMPMGQMDQMALYHINADQLPPGSSKSFDYTFKQPFKQGALEFACHLPDHYEAGMHLPITVTAS